MRRFEKRVHTYLFGKVNSKEYITLCDMAGYESIV